MATRKVVYQNWRVEQSRTGNSLPDSDRVPDAQSLSQEAKRYDPGHADGSLISVVERALGLLSSDEREFIARYHFMGETYGMIAERTGRLPHKLEALHRRAIRKLKSVLGGFALSRWPALRELSAERSVDEARSSCPLCRSLRRGEIDLIISGKRPEQTWRATIGILRDEFGITIRSPQTIIGHVKYHRGIELD